MDFKPKAKPIVVEEDVWEDAGDGHTMKRVYRRGQKITADEAVAAGMQRHPSEPPTVELTAEKPEPKPSKAREPQSVAGKKRGKRTVEDKARRTAKNKRR